MKPLGKELKTVEGFAGATILGDGRVALILDVLGVAQISNVLGEGRARAANEEDNLHLEHGASRDSLLVVRTSPRSNLGLQLAQVDRLEEVDRDQLQRAGGRDAIEYRGRILPLVYLRDLTGDEEMLPDAETLQIVVVEHRDRTFGVVVDEVLDIIDDRFEVSDMASRPGFIGSTIVQERMVDLVDLPGALELIGGGTQPSHQTGVTH